ncbi:hypothetical protein [Ruminococcus sp.]|uniref:hypothetical protein n=1 Tax=Ruminococcus sp. TaxID=41978 RepID=UPI00386D145A
MKNKSDEDYSLYNDSPIGKIVSVTVDRPLGSFHPKHRDIFYAVNYDHIKEKIL